MAKNDMAIKKWISDKRRFADLFNACLFRGEEVIVPQELEVLPNESDLILKDKEGAERAFQRYRDVVMRWRSGADFVVLASENQDKIHYAMPVRAMVYDGLSYVEQIEKMWKKQKGKGGKVEKEEFLSHFRKSDRLRPVITLVFYYGTKTWDGSCDLHSMMALSEQKKYFPVIEKCIPNYHINLLDVSRVKDPEIFRTDLQLIFRMLQYRNEKDALIQYLNEHRAYFGKLDLDTYRAVTVFLNSEKQLDRIMPEGSVKGEIDMCKALDDLYRDGIQEGMEEGIEKGIEKGIRVLVKTCMEFALSKEEAQKRIVREYELSPENAALYLEKYGK